MINFVNMQPSFELQIYKKANNQYRAGKPANTQSLPPILLHVHVCMSVCLNITTQRELSHSKWQGYSSHLYNIIMTVYYTVASRFLNFD